MQAAQFAGAEIGAAVDLVLDRLQLAERFSVERRAVMQADVAFCEETLARRGNSPRELQRALGEIADHFRVYSGSDPAFGLPEERWRAIIEEWVREFEVPANVVRYTAAGTYRGEKSRPVITSTRLFREYRDPATGVTISPAVILRQRLRRAAGLPELPALGEPRDIAANFLKPAQRFLKQAMGTPREKSAQRLLADMEAIAPVVLAPGGIYAAKRARDRFDGRLCGEQQQLEIPWGLEDRKLYCRLRKHRARTFTFGNVEFDPGLEKFHEVAARLEKGEA